MATAAKETSLASAMALAFAEIEAATKSANNPHFKSKYADLGAVIDAIKPPLIKHGLYFTQHCHPAEDGVSVETVLTHSGGEEKSLGILYLPANKRDAQGFGSALTYARRYGLMTAFGVPAEDDDGNAAVASTRSSGPANDRNGHARGTGKDAPFPQGPCKNVTELKTKAREAWREIEGCGDDDEMTAALKAHAELLEQLKAALPGWWNGGDTRGGEHFEGLGDVIARKSREFANEGADDAWKRNPVLGG